MRDKVVLNGLGFCLMSLGIVLFFSLFGQDVFGYLFVLIGVIMFFLGWYLLVESEKLTSYSSMKYYLKKKNTKQLFEENLRFRRSFTDKYNTFDDLLSVILLSMQKDKRLLPVFQSMYKNTRGAERLDKSKTYLLSYLIENKIEEFLEEYEKIIKVRNYVLEKGIGIHQRKEPSNWSVDEKLIQIFYDAYMNGNKVHYDKVKNDISYLVYIVIYYQYLQNTEQTSLASDFESDYNIIMHETSSTHSDIDFQ